MDWHEKGNTPQSELIVDNFTDAHMRYSAKSQVDKDNDGHWHLKTLQPSPKSNWHTYGMFQSVNKRFHLFSVNVTRTLG